MGETDRAGPADPRPGPPRVSPHPPHNRPSGQRAETQPARPWPTQRHAQQQPSTPLPGRQTVHSTHTKVEEADKITLSYKPNARQEGPAGRARPSAARGVQADDEPHRGGLAGPVRAEKPRHPPL